ncbi:MAG: glycosyltransferase [Armatimonadota bacterium]
MLKKVRVKPKSWKPYEGVIGKNQIDKLKQLAKKLKKAKILHVNATSYGGGVAEILHNMVPLMNDLGLDAEWRIIEGNNKFFDITKLMHNGLQGCEVPWTPKIRQIYLNQNEYNAKLLKDKYDFVVIHDPQPAAMLYFMKKFKNKLKGKFVWRCHIDLSNTFMPVWDFVRTYVEEYDCAIFTLKEYLKSQLTVKSIKFIPPSIDPLSDKNKKLTEEMQEKLIRNKCSIRMEDPLLTQISRFDPWKDPMGVMDAYRIVKEKIPKLQLVMLATMASDDPEGMHYLKKAQRHRGKDKDIHLIAEEQGVDNSLDVNAFQSYSDVILQKSIREGFGLTVTEAMWKGTPVVAGNVGGIKIQIANGLNGFLVDSVEECAERVKYPLKHPEEAKKIGQRGRRSVRNHYLIHRHIKDYLEMFLSL